MRLHFFRDAPIENGGGFSKIWIVGDKEKYGCKSYGFWIFIKKYLNIVLIELYEI